MSTRLKRGIVGGIIAAAAGLSMWLAFDAQARLRDADRALREQERNRAMKEEQRDRLAALAANAAANTRADLERLREEVAKLRDQTNGLKGLREESYALHEATQKARSSLGMPGVKGAERTDLMKARAGNIGQLYQALYNYAGKNGDRFPSNLNDFAPLLPEKLAAQTNFSLDQYEIVYHGSRSSIGKYAYPMNILFLREKQPWQNTDGKWTKTYVSLVGTIDTITVESDNFEAWEKAHIINPESTTP